MNKEEAIIELTHELRRWESECKSVHPMKDALRMAIEALSRPQGEWKIDEYGIYHCPICHAINNTVYKSFCPNCGARMKGGDSE